MTGSRIRVAILEDHQSIIDGYMLRLKAVPEIDVVGTVSYGEDLLPLLKRNPADVLLMDVYVPTSEGNRNPFPILHIIPRLLKENRDLRILAISVIIQNTLIEALVEAGVRGYIFKNDRASIQELAKIVVMTASGGVYFSDDAYKKLRSSQNTPKNSHLTLRQLEILSICAAYPDVSTAELGLRLGIANSTLRNLLSSAYLRLDVRTRSAAIARAQQLGLLVEANMGESNVND